MFKRLSDAMAEDDNMDLFRILVASTMYRVDISWYKCLRRSLLLHVKMNMVASYATDKQIAEQIKPLASPQQEPLVTGLKIPFQRGI